MVFLVMVLMVTSLGLEAFGLATFVLGVLFLSVGERRAPDGVATEAAGDLKVDMLAMDTCRKRLRLFFACWETKNYAKSVHGGLVTLLRQARYVSYTNGQIFRLFIKLRESCCCGLELINRSALCMYMYS